MGEDKLELAHLLRQSRQNSGEQQLQQYSMEGSPSMNPLNHQLPMHTLSPPQSSGEDGIPGYAYPPRNLVQTCPLDGLLLKFLSDQRERALQGVPIPELIGPLYPSFRALIDPIASEKSHPLSRVFTDMLGKFPDISTLPEQVAILYVFGLLPDYLHQPARTDLSQVHNVHVHALANPSHPRDL